MSRLKLAVMVPFVLFVALFATGVSVAEFLAAEREGQRIDTRIHAALAASFRNAVVSEVATMRSVTAALAQQELIRTAFRQRDREGLLFLTQGVMTQLREQSRITHLYFTDLTRVNLLRVHQPERYGDVINRQTQLLAERSGAPVHGIELGPFGTLTLRVVSPWYAGDQLLGYIELGVEIQHILDGMREQFGTLPLLFLPKGQLDRKGWEAGMRMLGRSGNWDAFDDAVLVVRDGVPDEVIRRFRESGVSHVAAGDRHYSWLHLPVMGVHGDQVADVGLVLDVTGRFSEVHRFGWTVATLALLGSGVVISLFWLVLSKVEGDLNRTRDDLARREALYHGAFSGSRAVQLLINPEDGAILDANPAATVFYGWSLAELTQMRLADLTSDDSAESVALGNSDLNKALDSGSSRFLSRHRLASGAVRDVEIYSGSILVGGRPVLYSIIHDIGGRMEPRVAWGAALA